MSVRRSGWVLGGLVLLVGACPGSEPTPPDRNDTGGSSSGPSVTGSETGPGSATSTGTAETSADSTGAGSGDTGPVGGCWDDLMPGEVEVFYEGFTDGSEGIAFGADGLMYVTTDGVVWQLQGDASVVEYALVPDALGLAGLAGGGFWVASFGVAAEPDGSVWQLAPDGTPSEVAAGIDSPNFITVAPDGRALVSDDFDTRVFAVDDAGGVEVIIEDVHSPNGMAYSPAGDAFFVASTFDAPGQLTRYDVDGDGLPIEASAVEIMHLGPGSTPDGIAVDEDGWVYVAANLFGEVWRVDGASPGLVEGELWAGDLGSPASLAFGRGLQFDPCSMYVTQLFGDQVLRVAVGVAGAPLYE